MRRPQLRGAIYVLFISLEDTISRSSLRPRSGSASSSKFPRAFGAVLQKFQQDSSEFSTDVNGELKELFFFFADTLRNPGDEVVVSAVVFIFH